MFDAGLTISFQVVNPPTALLGNFSRKSTQYGTKSNSSLAVQVSSVILQTDESGNTPKSKKISGSGGAIIKCRTTESPLLSQANIIGIIGGTSVFSTLMFLEKLVWWSSRDGEECIPFVLCNDPSLKEDFLSCGSFHSSKSENSLLALNQNPTIENLRHKRLFLEQSGACGIVVPCHMLHAWHEEVSEGCSVPFLHVAECVAKELSEAKLKPIETGTDVQIGVLATNATLDAGFYQQKLQSQGFEVVLPDKGTMEHILFPAIEAWRRQDVEGAQNLLRIAIQVLLIRAVNVVILAVDELQGLLPSHDPLLKKCIDPMDSLARSTIKWAKSANKTS